MKLIIAEKEEVARAIVTAMPGTAVKKNGYVEKNDYCVTWAMGHLFKLKDPEDYDSRYEKWNLEDLPIFFPEWEIKKIENKSKVIAPIEKLLKRDDIEYVIHAGDPDDEGQLLIDEILRYYKNNHPVKRVFINDNTPELVKKALTNLEDNKKYESQGWAAYARSVSDFLVGINMTRLFTLNNKGNGVLSIGRVQTPTLAMIVNRDLKIENHEKIKYYEFFSKLQIARNTNEKEREELEKMNLTYKQNFHDEKEREKILNKMIFEWESLKEQEIIEFKYFLPKSFYEEFPEGRVTRKNVFEELQKIEIGKVDISVEKKLLTMVPPLPFNLKKLQTYLNNKYGYSVSKILEITQTLRDKYSAITYNRSDCQYLSVEHYSAAPTVIPTILNNLKVQVPEIDYNRKSKCFDDSKVKVHHAIIPTNKELDLSELSEEERNVYKAIADHYIIQFLPPTIAEKTIATFNGIDNEEPDFKATSTKNIFLGYKAYLRDKDENEEKITELSKLIPGKYRGTIIEKRIEEKETKPLKRYTEGTIIDDMSSISKYVDDPEIRKLLLEKDKDNQEKGSIGTPATQSKIIETLFKRGYIENQGKSVISTKLGREFISILPEQFTKPNLTALWWAMQEEIKEGASPDILIKDVLNTIKEILSQEHKNISTVTKEKESVGKCLFCGGEVLIGKDKNGRENYYCENYKTCSFRMYEKMKHYNQEINLTKTKIKTLLKGEKILVTLKSKEGKTYDTYLKLKINKVAEKQYINFESAGYPKQKK